LAKLWKGREGMKTRCIHIFPRFEKNFLIEEIRKKYDDLYGCIEPHITLVFPFNSDIKIEDLRKDLHEILLNETPFEVIAQGIEAIDNYGKYIFLNISKGRERIIDLHYKLHKGMLEEYQSPWTKDGSYSPHITIGRFENKDEMDKAMKDIGEFDTELISKVESVYIEIIGKNEESIIEEVIELGDN